MTEKILIIDFGSQYTQLIARRVRELNVYSEIHPFHNFPKPGPEVKGIILSGSPYSVCDPGSPRIDLEGLINKIPVLGICYGAQLIAEDMGGKVLPSNKREYGRALLQHSNSNKLFNHISKETQVWM